MLAGAILILGLAYALTTVSRAVTANTSNFFQELLGARKDLNFMVGSSLLFVLGNLLPLNP